MKKIVLTKNNINMVCGMLKKFFYNESNGFVSYHNFNCGFRNIKPYSGIELNEGVDSIEIDNDFIRITFQKGVSGSVYHLGTVFMFKGNEIIIKKNWNSTEDYKYIYEVYRMTKLSFEDIFDIEERRAFELEMAEDYWNSLECEDCL